MVCPFPNPNMDELSATNGEQLTQQASKQSIKEETRPKKVNIRVLMVRHGETEYNITHRVQGHIDTPLNEKGQAQANQVAEYLKDVQIDFCLSSDLQRAFKTAEAIMQKQEKKCTWPEPIAEPIADARLRERSWGLLEGKTWPDGEIEPEVLKTVETLDALKERTLLFWIDFLSSFTFSSFTVDTRGEDGFTVLFVAHGGTFGALVEALVATGAVKFVTEELERKSDSKSSIGKGSLTEILMQGVEETWKNKKGREKKHIAWTGVVTRFGDDDHLSKEVESSTDTSADIEPDVAQHAVSDVAA